MMRESMSATAAALEQKTAKITVAYIDHMGNDDSVVNAARVSFSKRANQYTNKQNVRLINYLAAHNHEMPFAHTAISLRITAPISIRTQCFKHKIGFVENEVSRRYVDSRPEFFTPEFRHRPQGGIKQGSGKVIDTITADDVLHYSQDELQRAYRSHLVHAIAYYENLIALGVAPEQARFVLPQGVMTEWVWTGSLLAYARFYKLRTDSHAQQEIQDLAHMVGAIMADLYPISWAALTGGNDD